MGEREKLSISVLKENGFMEKVLKIDDKPLRKNTEKCDGYARSNCCDGRITFGDICRSCGEHCDTQCSDCEDLCEDNETVG